MPTPHLFSPLPSHLSHPVSDGLPVRNTYFMLVLFFSDAYSDVRSFPYLHLLCTFAHHCVLSIRMDVCWIL
jgi:hypothetical protein